MLFCFVWGQARLLGTLAVSRGLGDHQLKVIDTNIEVKPFLSCIPKVSRGMWELRGGIKHAASPVQHPSLTDLAGFTCVLFPSPISLHTAQRILKTERSGSIAARGCRRLKALWSHLKSSLRGRVISLAPPIQCRNRHWFASVLPRWMCLTSLCMTLRKMMSSSWLLMAFGMFCATKRWPIWSGASLQKTGQILTGNISFAIIFPCREPGQAKSWDHSASRSAPAWSDTLFCDWKLSPNLSPS